MLLSKVHLFHSQFEIIQDTSLSACEDHGRVESSLCLQSPWVSVSWDLARTLASNQDTEPMPVPEWEGFSIFLHFYMVLWSIASHQDAAPVGLLLQGFSSRSTVLQGVPYLVALSTQSSSTRKVPLRHGWFMVCFLWEAHLCYPLNYMRWKFLSRCHLLPHKAQAKR